MKVCKIDDCDRKHKGRGYCGKHLVRVRKYGDPHAVHRPDFAGERNPRWKGSNGVSYTLVHNRLASFRGKAASYGCVDCGSQAEEWAYDHSDPKELTGTSNGRPAPYSLDLDRYNPMCRVCHFDFDHRRRRISA